MESHIPTRPSSDVRRRVIGHKATPAAMETQHLAWPTRERHSALQQRRYRSSSFSSFGRSLSRLLPVNRRERGGTSRILGNESEPMGNTPALGFTASPINKIKAEENEDDGEEVRRTRSWSPEKAAVIVDAKDVEGFSESKLKKPSTFRKLWELHKVAKNDNDVDDFSQHPGHLRSENGDLRRMQSKARESLAAENKFPSMHLHTSLLASPDEVETPVKRSQQIYENKKARREQRRSYRESDDFLGIQGVNPRTGYTDPSTAESSSTGYVISESTRQKLEEDERRMKSASKEYKAALERREGEMHKLEIERERRRKEKKERGRKKKAEMKARRRRDGQWKSEGNRWSMAVEPDLTPILQSAAGSPTHEFHLQQAAIDLPSAVDQAPIPELSAEVLEDYFGPTVVHTGTPQRYYNSYVESASDIPLPPNHRSLTTASSAPPQRRRYMFPFFDSGPQAAQPLRYKRPTAEFASNNYQQSHLPVSSTKVSSPLEHRPAEIGRNGRLLVRRRENEFLPYHRRVSSTETVIHSLEPFECTPAELPDTSRVASPSKSSFATPKADLTTPKDTSYTLPLVSPNLVGEPFLDLVRKMSGEEGLQENVATAISYLSASTSQALIRLSLPPNQTATFQVKGITSLSELPPVILKDPFSARLPSGSLVVALPNLTPKAQDLQDLGSELESSTSTITTPITTITGFVPLPLLPNQMDGTSDIDEAQATPHQLEPPINTVQMPSFRQGGKINCSQNIESQTDPVVTAISSAHRTRESSTPTRQPIPRLCRGSSLVAGQEVLKNTPTSTFTSPQPLSLSPMQRQAIAQRAARTAFSNASPLPLNEAVKVRSNSLTSPKTRAMGIKHGLIRGGKTFCGGNEGIGDPSKSRDELEKNPKLPRTRIEEAIGMGGLSRNGGEDGFVAWCNEVEKKIRINEDKTAPWKKKDLRSSREKKHEGPGKEIPKASLLREAYRKLKEVIATGWWFIAPVFNPRSGLRWRWVRNEVTWQDIILIGAAAVFGGGTFLVVIAFARVLGMGLQIVKAFVGLLKLLIGV